MPSLNEALADELVRQGVTRCFGLFGEDVIQLGVQLDKRGVEFIAARHESQAISMADGYARVSGELAVAIVSRGPGITNALTGLANAAKGRNKLVVIAGDCDPGTRGVIYSKWADQKLLFDGAGIPFVTIDSPESAVADVAAIFDRARTGELIVVNLPGEILEATAGDAPSTVELPPGQPGGGEPAAEEISVVADVLGETWAFRRPMILAGRGAARAGAREELERLAERTGAILCTTLMAKGLFDGHPYNVGICGTYSTEPAVELIPQADVVLVFGAILDPLTTVMGSMFPNARVIRFDRDPEQAERGAVPVEMFVEADAKLAAAALADELERRGHQQDGYHDEATRSRIAEFRLEDTIRDQGAPGALDPRFVMIRLNKLLPAERTVVIDNGHHAAFSTAHLDVPGPDAFISPLEFHCVGAATGMAIGAVYARPDRLTTYIVGDCGLLMTFGELETIGRYQLPMLVVVVNDAALGAEVQYLRALGLPDKMGTCPAPSFAAVAEALGFEAWTVETLDDLDRLEGRLDKIERPILIDVPVTCDVRADWVELLMSSGAHGEKEPAIS